MDNRWRARMFGSMSAGSGLVMLGIAPLIALVLREWDFPNNYALLFGISGILFVVSIVPVLFIEELPGGKAVEKLPALSEYLPDLGRILRNDRPFRSIMAARMLTSLFAMAAPFYIGFATESLGMSSETAVPTLLAMQTIGGVIGALAYTWIGARSNLLYIRLALLGGALWPVSALLAGMVGPLPLYFGYLMSGFAVLNLGLSFQNWVVTYAIADRRPVYVGLFNTLSVVITLIAPVIAGTIVQRMGYRPLFVVSLLMAFSALFVMLRFVRDAHMEEPPHDIVMSPSPV
jgi:MFS family permease